MKHVLLLALLLAPMPVFAQTATVQEAGVSAPLTCLLWPNRRSDIGADTGGMVAQVLVRRTSRVQKGDLLLQLDDRIAQADLAKAVISRDITNEKLKRAEALTQGRSISADEIATLRADAAMAEVEHQRAQLQVARTKILAPFDGTVADISTEAGQLINAQPLLSLIETQRLRAEIVLPAEAFGQMHVGDVLQLSVDLMAAKVQATVATIDDYIDASSNSFTVIAEIENPNYEIPAGVGCQIDG